jgi:midasin (ATPase involved in ribosome maturation)
MFHVHLPQIRLQQVSARQFIEIIDVFAMGIALRDRVIFHGPCGQGKGAAVAFVSQKLGLQVMRIALSSIKSVEDLFCQMVPHHRDHKLEFHMQGSCICDDLDAETAKTQIIIVLAEMHQVQASDLDALAPLFDTTKTTLVLPKYSLRHSSVQTSTISELRQGIAMNSFCSSVYELYTQAQQRPYRLKAQ